MSAVQLYENIITIVMAVIVGVIFLVLTWRLKDNAKGPAAGTDKNAGDKIA